MKKRYLDINIPRLLIALLVVQAVGVIGSLFTTPFIASWYAQIEKPFFTPPNWVFGPVWSILYLLMGLSLYLIWNAELTDKEEPKRKFALRIFFAQLVLNIAWSIIFFTFQAPLYAFIELLVLLCLIYVNIMKFKEISLPAAWLLMPYLAWSTFAALLNFSIILLNGP